MALIPEKKPIVFSGCYIQQEELENYFKRDFYSETVSKFVTDGNNFIEEKTGKKIIRFN